MWESADRFVTKTYVVKQTPSYPVTVMSPWRHRDVTVYLYSTVFLHQKETHTINLLGPELEPLIPVAVGGATAKNKTTAVILFPKINFVAQHYGISGFQACGMVVSGLRQTLVLKSQHASTWLVEEVTMAAFASANQCAPIFTEDCRPCMYDNASVWLLTCKSLYLL